MFRKKLEELGVAVIDFFVCLCAALWRMAVLNRRTTAGGIVGAVVFVGSRYGLSLTDDQQTTLGLGIILLLGLLAGDSHLKKGIR